MYAILAYIQTNSEHEPMTYSSDLKRDRMHLRLDSETKKTLERAASYQSTSVSEFVLANAVAAAEKVIEAHERMTLPAPDWDLFYDALVNPPKPNAKLKRALRRYRERIGE